MPSTKSNVCTKWCQNCLSEEVTVDNLFVLVDAAVRGLEAERRLGNFDFFDSRWWKLLLKFDPKIRSHELNRLALPASLLSPRRSSAIMHKSSRSLTSAGLARDSGKAQWKREAMKEECTRSEKFVRWERQKWSINLEMDELDDARGTWLYAFESSLSRYWNFLRVFTTKFGDSLKVARRLILMSLQSQLKLDVKLEKCQSKSRVSWPSATSSSSSTALVTSETRFSSSSLESC